MLSCTAWTSDALDLHVCLLHQSPSGRMSIFAQVHLLLQMAHKHAKKHPDWELRLVLASGCLLFTHPLLWQPAGLRLLPTSFCLEVLTGLLGRQLWSFELKPRPHAHPAGSHASEEQMVKSKLTNGLPSRPTPQMKGNILAWNFFFFRNTNRKCLRPMLISHSVWTRLRFRFSFK